MTESPDSSRREFLTGQSVRKELLHQGDQLADALLGEAPPAPPVASETVRLETRAMACRWAVVLNPGPPRNMMVATDALDCVHIVEQILTVYRDNSDVALVNRTAGTAPAPVSEELFGFLQTCQMYQEQTAGAFDPSAGTLIQLWRTARAAHQVPDAEQVAAALANSGFEHVTLDAEARTVFFQRPGLLLDFGSIGKGWAVDRAAAHVTQEQVADFLIHGGQSSILAAGDHNGHRGWPVGIKNPLFTDRRYATILLRDQAMSTSGSNVQYFRYGGRRYGHLLDPRTGWPADEMLSVTVVAPTATQAEALSTAFYVMGLDKARRYCHDHPEVGAILIPPPSSTRKLAPVVCNIPSDQLFFDVETPA